MQIRDELLRQRVVNREVVSRIVVTEADIKEYYDRHSDRYGGETKYHLRHILMKPPALADEKEEREIKSRMERIQERLKAGESFRELAERHSESPVAAQGGDLGQFELSSLSEQIRTAVVDLKPGQFTPVLDTEQGHQIFLLEEIVETPGTPLEEVSEEIQKQLFNEIVNEKYSKWIEGLKKRAHIKIIR